MTFRKHAFRLLTFSQEWDLNTGQTARTYPTHGAQLSSIAIRPFAHPPSPSPSPNVDIEPQQTGEARENISISIGPDFFEKRDAPSTNADEEPEPALDPNNALNIDVEMSDKPSPVNSLFDDDAEGEAVTPTVTGINDMNPQPHPPALALPNTFARSSASMSLFPPAQTASSSRPAAASNIPVLSPASYKSFTEDVLLTSSMDGQVVLIDRRAAGSDGSSGGVGRLLPGDKAPPWCMSVREPFTLIYSSPHWNARPAGQVMGTKS